MLIAIAELGCEVGVVGAATGPDGPPPKVDAPAMERPDAPPLPPGWPDETNTGWQHTGVTLTPYTGSPDIDEPGTVIDGKDITFCIRILADNVTIKRSRIRCTNDGDAAVTYGVGYLNANPSGLLMEDTEISSTYQGADCTTAGLQVSLADHAFTSYYAMGGVLRRLYVHGTRTGVKLGDNMTLEDSFVANNCNPDEDTDPSTDWQHSTAAANGGGGHHIVMRHNNLRTAKNANASSAISFYTDPVKPGDPQDNPSDDLLIDGNLLNTGGGYCAYLAGNTNVKFTNNRFGTVDFPSCGMYGPIHSWTRGGGNVWSNNTWLDLRPTQGGYQNKDSMVVPEP